MVAAGHNRAESDLKDYGKEYPVVEVDRLSWVLVIVIGGIVYAYRITAGPDVGELPLGGFSDKTVSGQVLWLKPES